MYILIKNQTARNFVVYVNSKIVNHNGFVQLRNGKLNDLLTYLLMSLLKEVGPNRFLNVKSFDKVTLLQ